MSPTSALFTSFFATVLMATGPASAAWFLKMEGVTGRSADAKHSDWFEIQSFKWGTESHLTLGSASRAAQAQNQNVSFKITTTSDKSLAALGVLAATGRRVPNAVIESTRPEGSVFLRIKLQDVLVVHFQMGAAHRGGNGLPTDSMELNYSKVRLEYIEATPTPSHGTVKPVAIAPKR